MGDRPETTQELARTHMKRIIAIKYLAMIIVAVLCFFLSAYLNYRFIEYIIKQYNPKITVVI
jgi:hypothetical protein